MKSTPILHAPLLQNTLLSRQIEMEENAIKEGVKRYEAMVNEAIERGDGASLKPAERMILFWFESLRQAVADEKRSILRGEKDPGRGIYGPLFNDMDSARLAYIAVSEIVSACMKEPKGTRVLPLAYQIGKTVLGELMLDRMKSNARDALNELTHRFRQLNPSKLNWWAKKNLMMIETERRACAHTGVRLVWLVIENCLIPVDEDKVQLAFHHRRTRFEGKDYAILVMDQKAHQKINEGHEFRKTMRPRYRPMLIRPMPWKYVTSEDGHRVMNGGYVRIRTPFISKPTVRQKQVWESLDLSQIMDGVNALSATPMRVNGRMLEIVKEVWKLGGNIGRIPSASDEQKPDKPETFGSDEEKSAWLAEWSRVKKINRQLVSDRQEFLNVRDMADELKNEKELYFPHQLDHRGRAYPIPVHLNHHGNDVCRSLLEFSQPVGVDRDGRRWLEIHAANCYGFDKVSFDTRVGWVSDNMRHIERSVENPTNDEFWMQAKKPWQFLAACFALTNRDAGERMPVQIDGTANGLQHYAALGRDDRAAPLVNLTAGSAPSDIYLGVHDETKPRVARDAQDHTEIQITYRQKKVTVRLSEIASAAMSVLSRDVVKSPIMTNVYGVTAYGARKQIKDAIADSSLSDMMKSAVAGYLSNMVLSSLADVCSGAHLLMAWIRNAAAEIARCGYDVAWTDPMGFKPVLPQINWRRTSCCTVMGKFRIRRDDGTGAPAVRKQANASAPGFVHSLDKVHMLWTAMECEQSRLAFAGVHDAFWSHASSMDRLARITREQFVRLHSLPIMEALADEWTKKYQIKLPELPSKGWFDINEVLDSPYFFS